MWPKTQFIHSFIHPFIHSFIHSFIHLFCLGGQYFASASGLEKYWPPQQNTSANTEYIYIYNIVYILSQCRHDVGSPLVGRIAVLRACHVYYLALSLLPDSNNQDIVSPFGFQTTLPTPHIAVTIITHSAR